MTAVLLLVVFAVNAIILLLLCIVPPLTKLRLTHGTVVATSAAFLVGLTAGIIGGYFGWLLLNGDG